MSLDKPYKNIPGTIIFDAEQARKGYQLNQLAMSLMKPENRERFLADTDPDLVGLCFDTGHHAYCGGDAVAFMRRHHDRVGYLHVKSVDPAVLEEARREALPFALTGGLLYTVGAVLVALKWPARVAKWFGYHEWWHAYVVAAGACFFAMNAYLIATATG